VILALAGFYFLSSKNGKPTESATVELGEVREDLILSGELRAQEHAKLAFSSSGTVNWVGVEEGQWVEKGEALLKLDTTVLNSTYQRALSAYRLTQATVAKVHDDLKNKGNSETFTEKETRTTAEVANDQAYETMVAAEKALRDATLKAPFAGLVTNLASNSSGVNITLSVVQVEVVNPTTMYLSVNADQTEVSNFKIGDKTEIVFEVGSTYPMRVALDVDNSNYKYRVGMTADSKFMLRQKQNVLYVPPKFVKSDKDGKYVLTQEGKQKVYITVGIEGDDRVEISGNIKKGEKVYND
jgi:multidrug resistance efflux pump